MSLLTTHYLKRSAAARKLYSVATARTLDAAQLLLGSENGMNPNGYAQVMGDLLWTSTQIQDSLHVRFLSQYACDGEAVFENERLEQTTYYRNAIRNIELFGHYYEAKSKQEVIDKMRKFADKMRRDKKPSPLLDSKQKFTVRPIRESKCYQMITDHHDIALAYVKGQRKFKVHIANTKTQTALQELLGRVLWFQGNRELYQPINQPEIRDAWVLTRKCSDRLLKMQEFLRQKGMIANLSYVDIGSFYGWFVHKMIEFGLDGWGVEIDPIAASVGFGCYGLSPARIHVKNAAIWLQQTDTTYDVASCLSVLHHFVAGVQPVSAVEFIRLLARTTKKVLFLDTGQEHEGCSHGQLAGWNPDFIEKWVLAHTDFKRAYRLGVDEDAHFPHANDYGRMLFAFVR